MNFDKIPIWILFLGATIAVMICIEVGYRLGWYYHHRSEEEKEAPVSAIAGTILGLVAFMAPVTKLFQGVTKWGTGAGKLLAAVSKTSPAAIGKPAESPPLSNMPFP